MRNSKQKPISGNEFLRCVIKNFQNINAYSDEQMAKLLCLPLAEYYSRILGHLPFSNKSLTYLEEHSPGIIKDMEKLKDFYLGLESIIDDN